MQVKSIAECSKGSILQYFRPLLSYNFPLRPLFAYSKWPHKTGFTVYASLCICCSHHDEWATFYDCGVPWPCSLCMQLQTV